MLEIEYKGGNCVVLSTKRSTLYVDPKLSVVGLKDSKLNDEIEVATEARFAVDNEDARIIIECPGEYEVGDFTLRGIAATRHIDTENDDKKSTIYRVETNDFTVAIIGNITPDLNDTQLEEIGMVDILILPVGGNGYTLDATAAASLARLIEPKLVIPVHYADTKLRYEVPQDEVSVFQQALGVPVAEAVAKLKLKSTATLPPSLTLQVIERS